MSALPPVAAPRDTRRRLAHSALGVLSVVLPLRVSSRQGRPDRGRLAQTGDSAPCGSCSSRTAGKGGSPPCRAHQRRPELQVACGLRRPRITSGAVAVGRADERSQGRCPDAGHATTIKARWVCEQAHQQLSGRNSGSAPSRAIVDPAASACADKLHRLRLPTAPEAPGSGAGNKRTRSPGSPNPTLPEVRRAVIARLIARPKSPTRCPHCQRRWHFKKHKVPK